MPPAPLTISEILSLADKHHRMTGTWPHGDDRRVHGLRGENWRKIDNALRLGLRGLPGGSSLARLLAEKRGVRNLGQLPRLTYKQILEWAEVYYHGTGKWPTSESGHIPDSDGESWKSVDHALRLGSRNLPGGSSLARLLALKRRVRNIQQLPHLVGKTDPCLGGCLFCPLGRLADRQVGSSGRSGRRNLVRHQYRPGRRTPRIPRRVFTTSVAGAGARSA